MDLHSGSQASVSAAVDLFSLPPSDVTSVNSEVSVFYPIGNYKENQNPLQFVINTPPAHYLELNSARLYMQVKVVKLDGTPLGEVVTTTPARGETPASTTTVADDVAPTFNFLQVYSPPVKFLLTDIRSNAVLITTRTNTRSKIF